MARFSKLTFFVLCTITSAFPTTSVNATEAPAIPPDYTAIYQVFRNHKNIAEVTIRLSHRDDIWTLHGYTHDMQGLANFLRIKGAQTTTGTWLDGKFIPEDYKFSFSLIGYKTDWHADFDWSSGLVTTHGKAGDTQLLLADNAVDPFSLSLNIRSQLAKNQTQMSVSIIDESEINNHMYEAGLEEPVDTALGCLETTRVRRIRENSKRTSMVWYANDYNYVPVLMQHSKKNGNDFRLKIISLDVNGLLVQPVSPCGLENPGSRQAGLNQASEKNTLRVYGQEH